MLRLQWHTVCMPRGLPLLRKDDKVAIGRVAPVDYRLPVLRLASDPLSDDAVEIPKDDIVSYPNPRYRRWRQACSTR